MKDEMDYIDVDRAMGREIANDMIKVLMIIAPAKWETNRDGSCIRAVFESEGERDATAAKLDENSIGFTKLPGMFMGDFEDYDAECVIETWLQEMAKELWDMAKEGNR